MLYKRNGVKHSNTISQRLGSCCHQGDTGEPFPSNGIALPVPSSDATGSTFVSSMPYSSEL